MTDLQCPATAILLDAGAEPPPWLGRHRLAARFDLADPCDVAAVVEETADRFRGETFAIAAPADAIALALRRRGLPGGPPLLVDVDSDGWRLAP
ncbi:hypothetical protein [Arthrobacter antioxidans]|uniref:hypothetical protein n=1 Tax=Arthrobacter antioxidans TaxID=2895818 RepID=UPI001FFECB09|nr:hypothetical protein [Arthrobacter antioxidans]